jgi:hypothetical protein
VNTRLQCSPLGHQGSLAIVFVITVRKLFFSCSNGAHESTWVAAVLNSTSSVVVLFSCLWIISALSPVEIK